MADLTRGGLYAVIPASVLYDDTLPPTAKLVYGEINRLASSGGYCWAKNQEFCRLCGCSERTVQRLISVLAEHGHIRIAMIRRNGDAGDVVQRRIYIGQVLGPEKEPQKTDGEEVPGGGDKNDTTSRQNCHHGGDKNVAAFKCIKNTRSKSKNPLPPKTPNEVLNAITEYIGDDPEFQAAFDGFFEMRRKIRKPMLTERAVHILINKLRANRASREIQIAMLDKATEYNWTSVYPLKPDEMSDEPKRENGGRFL